MDFIGGNFFLFFATIILVNSNKFKTIKLIGIIVFIIGLYNAIIFFKESPNIRDRYIYLNSYNELKAQDILKIKVNFIDRKSKNKISIIKDKNKINDVIQSLKMNLKESYFYRHYGYLKFLFTLKLINMI